MTENDRRSFLKLMGAGTLAASLPTSIAKALAIPANNATGTIADIEHIVILMQENRSFDHYFGTLRGVRGYSDPRAVTLPSGQTVWNQPDGSGGVVLPFRPDAPDLGLTFIEDLAHDWGTTHAAWNLGNYDGWVPNKGSTTMAHLTRQDIPYHYALADAFTVCDAYHCSLLGPTDPNRYHMWTGWVGNDGSGGGPVIDNAEAGYGWSTYPERLQQAGVSWKIYQDVGNGLTEAGEWGYTSDAYIGNYGDNSLLYFFQYQNAAAGSPLAAGAKTGTDILASGTLFDQFRADIAAGTLPQVSWVVAPEAYTEHPNWPANYGAWYISQILDALTDNPAVWSRTALFLVYDENDGFFDHMVPPTPPGSAAEGASTVSTVNELFPGDATYAAGPYGLGVRVPALVISPWTKGGYVNSQVFDHTSLIRFIEQRFGPANPALVEPNITPWRRAVAGDLTSAFNFKTPNDAPVTLPSTAAYVPPDAQRHPSYVPVVPTAQAVPKQERGLRLARALPYQMHAFGAADPGTGTFRITFVNEGAATVVFQVRSGNPADLPRSYTVSPGATLADAWKPVAATGAYDLSVIGPNGFLRAFRGTLAPSAARLQVTGSYDTAGPGILLDISNRGASTAAVTIANRYTGGRVAQSLAPGEAVTRAMLLEELAGWYDLAVTVAGDPTFLMHVAGHVENGRDSIADPALGIG